MSRFVTWLIAHGRWVFATVVGVSLVFGAAAVTLRLEFRPGDLLPQKHPFIAVHNQYHRDFTETNVLTVMLEARHGTIFTPAILTTLWNATQAVDALPGVNHDQVTSIAHRSARWGRALPGGVVASDPMMTRPPTTAAQAAAIRRTALQSYAFGVLVSLDERAAVIRAGFNESRLDYRHLFDAVNRTVLPLASDLVDIHVSGQPRLNGWILRLEGQVYVAFAAAVLVTWLCLYAYFRDWRGALRPTISGGLAALWGFGLIRLTGFALNPLTLLIPFLITARAVSHSAQMHDRYYEELETGQLKGGAVTRSFTQLFAPTLAGIVTDALGVLAIAIVAIPALQALAVAATFWLMSLVVTELLLNPVVYSRLRAPELATIRMRADSWLSRAMGVLIRTVLAPRGRRRILAGATVAGALAVALLPLVGVGDPASASRILKADAEYNRSHRLVQERFGGSEPFMIVAEGDRPKALENATVLRTIEKLQRTLERNPLVGASFSLVDILESVSTLFHELEPKWGVIPERDDDIRGMFFVYWATVFPSTSAQFFSPDFRVAPVTFYCRDHDLPGVRALVRDAERFIAEHPLEHVRFRLAGGFVGVMAAVYDEIMRSDLLMTVTSFAVIFVVVLVTYRSVVAAFLLVLPLLLANAVVNAYMAVRGIGLDLNTLPVVAVGVGFGIDYGIYLLSRVQDLIRDGATLEDAVAGALARAGRTVAFTSLSMTAGVLCFALTDLRFVDEMAVLLALWMLTSAATALVVMPAALLVIRPRFLQGAWRVGAPPL